MTPDHVLAMVERVMYRPWDWSRDWHCLGDAADVFLGLWGLDPMAGLRGKATSLCRALQIVRGAGGMACLLEREFAATGLVQGRAVPGSICVAPTTSSPFGDFAAAICIMPGVVAGKTNGGFEIMQTDVTGWIWPS
jgi:hypothetical protein